MRTRMSILFFVVSLSFTTKAQPKIYFTYARIADSLYRVGQFYQSAQMYNAAFSAYRGKAFVWERYQAARSWAMAGVPDSALMHLETVVYKERYCALHVMTTDTAFRIIHDDQRWIDLIDTAHAISEKNKARIAATKNLYEPELGARLDSIRKLDQQYRNQVDETEKKYGRLSPEMKDLWAKMRRQDSINLITIEQILDSRGWLGPEIVHSGSATLFLVIQHADLNTQLKYLPMIREAAKNGKLDKPSLAMLEDRVLLGTNKKQIYGTQIRRDSITGERYVAPMIDPDNVDKRRAEIGLGPLADYVSHWDLGWDIEDYKQQMARREKHNNSKVRSARID